MSFIETRGTILGGSLDSKVFILGQESLEILKRYLLDHEYDISEGGINDFGELEPLFIELFGREPTI